MSSITKLFKNNEKMLLIILVIFPVIVISLAVLSLFVFNEYLLTVVLVLIGMPISGLGLGLYLGRLSETISKKIAKSPRIRPFIELKPNELNREDDILLQATGFLQTGLLIFISLLGDFVSNVFNYEFGVNIIKALIVISGITFYLIRAIAKLKDNNNLRFISNIVLALTILVDIFVFFWIIELNITIEFLLITLSAFTLTLLANLSKFRYSK